MAIINGTNVDDKTMLILARVKSPTFDEVLGKYMSSGYNSYDNNAHNTDEQNVEGLEQFCKLIYTDWYNYMVKYNSSFTGAWKAVSDIIANDQNFNPEHIDKHHKVKHPYYWFYYHIYDAKFIPHLQKIYGDQIPCPFAKLQNGEEKGGGLIKDEEGAGGDDFLHVFGYLATGKDREKTDARLYLNLKAKNIPLFAIEAYKKCKDQKLPFYFKFGLQDSRNDTLLFYTSYQNLPKYLAVIEQIKKEHPELLEGCEQVSQNMGVLNGYIGYGDDPTVKDEDGHNYSFNSLRKEVVNEIKDELHSKVFASKDKFMSGNNDTFAIFPSGPASFDDCLDMLAGKVLSQHMNNMPKGVDIESAKSRLKSRIAKMIRRKILYGSVVSGEDVQTCRVLGNGNGKNDYLDIDINIDDCFIQLLTWSGRKIDKQTANGGSFDYTASRGYLARFMYCSRKGLNQEEFKLISLIRDHLVDTLRQELVNKDVTEEIKERDRKMLGMFNIPFEKMDDITKGYLLIAAVRFAQSGQISFGETKKGSGLAIKCELDVYKEFLGEKAVHDCVHSVCQKKHVSEQNICFNAETYEQIAAFMIEQQRSERQN